MGIGFVDDLWRIEHGIHHTPRFTGDIWFVDAAVATSGSGETPYQALKTIKEAVTLASAGDAITVKAGVYSEDALDLNKDGLELWGEIGVVIGSSVGGTVLTVSGDYCWVEEVWLTEAGQVGMALTGARCYIMRVQSGPGNSIGFDVDGTANVLERCHAGQPTTTGFDIGANGNALRDCNAIGTGAGTRGFHVSAGLRNKLFNCASVANTTAGFEIATGSNSNLLENCASGAGDGRWVDADLASVWSNFTYDDTVYKITTFNGGTTYNIFKITGAVRVSDIHGHVDTEIPNVASDLHLELFSTGGAVDITNGPGTNIQAAVVGALLVRNAESTVNIDLADPNGTPALAENANWRDPKTIIDVVKDDGADTYIRAVLSVAQANGAIHWHCMWEPLTESGFLEAA